MKSTLAIVAAALAVSACGTNPTLILRPGHQIVIGPTPTQFDEFKTTKPHQFVDVKVEDAPAPKKADFRLLTMERRP